MSFEPALKPGEELDNKRLCDTFKCSPQGGMRRSLKTNTLVIVSNHVESLYEDRWDSADVLHYTGMGRIGDQSITFFQNKTLAECRTNGVEVFLFEVHKEKVYTFRGQAVLTGQPYTERQPDEKGNERIVWMFPLRLAGDAGPLVVSEREHRENLRRKERQARKLSDDDLLLRARHAPEKPGRQRVETNPLSRDPHVAELAKRNADGVCQLCGSPAPFSGKTGRPYLETHHVVWLSRGGPDSIENTVALCPNCHRRMHILDTETDKATLKAIVRRLH